jgi:hypothetical protein
VTGAKPCDTAEAGGLGGLHVRASQGAAGVGGQSIQDSEARLRDNLYGNPDLRSPLACTT